MTTSLKGLLAVNKPVGFNTMHAIRLVSRVFKTSPILADTLAAAGCERKAEINDQQERPKSKNIIKDGGALDAMASGVLVTAIGDGMKHLPQYRRCPRTYEAVALFGCATDSYNAVGKVVKRAAYSHITKAAVEKALKAFRGNIIQRPPIFPALRLHKELLNECVREGKKLPFEIKARSVKCELLQLVDFTTNHSWDFPKEEASEERKAVCAALQKHKAETGDKHAREEVAADVEPAVNKKALEQEEAGANPEAMLAGDSESNLGAVSGASEGPRPPAITLRMTVSPNFYARSLIHDLGEALGSAAHVVKLVRTQHGQFKIGKNVLEWADLQNEDTLKAWSKKQKRLG